MGVCIQSSWNTMFRNTPCSKELEVAIGGKRYLTNCKDFTRTQACMCAPSRAIAFAPYSLPVVPARRGGSCLRVILQLLYVTIRPFSELACAVCQPGPCVRALCEPVALLLSKNMTCAGPRCNATPSEHFLHTSHCALHTPHFTLHTCTSSHRKSCELFSPHLTSSQLFSSHPISSHMSSK